MPNLSRAALLSIKNHEELAKKLFPEKEGFKIKPARGHYGEFVIVISDEGSEALVFSTNETPQAATYMSHFRTLSTKYIFVFFPGNKLMILMEDLDDLGRLKPKASRIPWSTDGITNTFLTALKNMNYGNFESFDNLFERKEVTKKFYEEYIKEFDHLLEAIQGISDPMDKRHFAQIFADRLIFLHFIQEKNLLDERKTFLKDTLVKTSKDIYAKALKPLFSAFNQTGLEKPPFGKIPYLNGSLFRPSRIEEKYTAITIPDAALKQFLQFLGGGKWNWHIDETREPDDDYTLDPQLLGHIFEKTVNQKEVGAYYTPKPLTGYLAKRTIHPRLLELWGRSNPTLEDALKNSNSAELVEFAKGPLANIKILDNANGSGAFLLSALNTLMTIWDYIIPKLEDKKAMQEFLQPTRDDTESWKYAYVKHIITNNIYGVDIEPGACEITKLRLWLALISHAPDDPKLVEPLPNIDFKIRTGDSLLGFTNLSVKDLPPAASLREVSGIDLSILTNLPGKTSQEVIRVLDKITLIPNVIRARRVIAQAHSATRSSKEAETYENAINHIDKHLKPLLDELFLDKLTVALGKEWRNSFDRSSNMFTLFHWPMEFPEVIIERNGFDCIISNPPWEKVKVELQDFHKKYNDKLSGSKRELNANQVRDIIQQIWDEHPDIKHLWTLRSNYADIVSEYFNSDKHWPAQKSVIDGKKKSGDSNFYKIFLERYPTLLVKDGKLGVVMHGGFYFSQGTKGLREFYWDNMNLEELLGYWNKKGIFENVDSRLRFSLNICTKKDGTGLTDTFFMAENPDDVTHKTRIPITPANVKEMSPKDWAYQEIQDKTEIDIIKSQFSFKTLTDISPQLYFTTETHQTADRKYISPDPTGNPYYRGEMIWYYDPHFAKESDWVLPDIRKKMAKRTKDNHNLKNLSTTIDNDGYRIGIRRVSSGTNERTLIASILPPPTYCANTIYVCSPFKIDNQNKITYLDGNTILSVLGMLNTLSADYFLRRKVESTIYVGQLEDLRIPTLDNIPDNQKARFLWAVYDQISDHCTIFKPSLPRPKELDAMKNWDKRVLIEVIAAKAFGFGPEEFKTIGATFTNNALGTVDLVNQTLEELEKMVGGD